MRLDDQDIERLVFGPQGLRGFEWAIFARVVEETFWTSRSEPKHTRSTRSSSPNSPQSGYYLSFKTVCIAPTMTR